jgi:anti-sigma regulatory factor (Ser/Thr protein kinase)
MTTGDRPGSGGQSPPAAAEHADEVLVDQRFDLGSIVTVRAAVAAHTDRLGLGARSADLAVLVHELASNAIRHGGGEGRLRLWTAGGALHCEVSDDGLGLPPGLPLLARRPPLDGVGGRGIWLARALCDHLDLVSTPRGTTVTATVLLADEGGR